ncbi:MAG: hypothetical protein ACI9N1_000919 [Flavobacteriales bacterium]|jgi:hypothetical protein
MDNHNIFIHIPKCGGSSFVGLLKDSITLSAEQSGIPTHIIDQIGETEIKHIDFSTSDRKFKAPFIFDHRNNDKLLNRLTFMLVRNPVNRLLSEYNFQYHILNGKAGNPNAAIISKLIPLPHKFIDYASFTATQNYQCKFLIGRKIADPEPLEQEEFDQIIKGIEKLDIHCGITDQYQAFLNLFVSKTNASLKNHFVHRKRTPTILKSKITDADRLKIEKLNSFDMALFKYVLTKIKSIEVTSNKTFIPTVQNQFIP